MNTLAITEAAHAAFVGTLSFRPMPLAPPVLVFSSDKPFSFVTGLR